MSGKSKKTTGDKTVCNEKQTKYISNSASKMVNKLSLSFYGENTLKMQKQIILDTYDDLQPQSPLSRKPSKPNSLSRGKMRKPNTPIIRFPKPQYIQSLPQTKQTRQIRPPETAAEKKSSKKSIRERSSSKSSRGKNTNSVLFSYISNRMDGSAKGWSALRPMIQNKNSHLKKL